MRVLIVDDNTDITTSLQLHLRTEGFVVDVANDGLAGAALGRVNEYDAIVLDYNLPGKNGQEICQYLRADGKLTPIIMLTVVDTVDQKVTLLNTGADDYMTKPFQVRELVARLRAVLRRPRGVSKTILQVADLVLESNRHTVTRGKRALSLTPKEFMILELLLQHSGEAVSRSQLLEHVWDEQADPMSNSLDMHLSALRKKVDRPPARKLIETVPGIGYKIRLPG